MFVDKNRQWFENWFDSPYYHILYKHRNLKEAESFIDNLITFLHPESNARFLDIGCGKGRHAVYLNTKGYKVAGIDLSPANITCASQFENENLKFYTHDMREVFRTDYFDYALNMFTSFGYFENECDDYAILYAVSRTLKPAGIFVLDFMNVEKVLANLVQHETKIIDGIEFKITRSMENNFIDKHINFSDQGKKYNFRERVKALTLNDFRKYFDLHKLKILNLRGNYNLEEYNPRTSNRLIIIAQKE